VSLGYLAKINGSEAKLRPLTYKFPVYPEEPIGLGLSEAGELHVGRYGLWTISHKLGA